MVAPAKQTPQLAAKYPLKILVAEDNVINTKVIMTMLRRMGYTPMAVVNGALAVAAVRNAAMGSAEPFDLVLMDVQMPVMDGLEASQQIRASVPSELQPCIAALTANSMTEDRDRCISAGMDAYLSKPITADALRPVLESCLRIRSSSNRPALTPRPATPRTIENTPAHGQTRPVSSFN